MKLKTPDKILAVSRAIKRAGGTAYIVGGWVRDQLLNRDAGDIDLEVFGLTAPQLEKALSPFHPTQKIGKVFGVYKIGSIDIALARTETKTGPRHQNFKIKTNPRLTPQQTSRRRDFTVNALIYNPLAEKVLDFHGGLKDLKNQTLKIIDPRAFAEDALRVYRLASLASRLNFKPTPATLKTCQKMLPQLKYLSKERVSEEWEKILLDSPVPSVGLKILEKIGVIKEYYPELEAMIGCPQEPLWHPEGDVWTHTLIALDYMADKSKKDKLVLMLAALLHDIGKPKTTRRENGRIRSKRHETQAVAGPLIRQFFRRLTFSDCDNQTLIKKVTNLTIEHMVPYQLSKNLEANQSIDKALRRLSVRLKPATVSQLLKLTEADYFATQGKKEDKKPFDESAIYQEAEKLAIAQSQPRPLLSGKDLIKLGKAPGPIFGKILKTAYEKQLDGKIKNRKEALQWLKSSRQF